MKRVFSIWLACLLLSALTGQAAEVSLIRNGSFEMDGQISDISVYPPANWLDVNIPASKFSGAVNNYWAVDGNLSLAISTGTYATFQKDDIAYVAQCIYFSDVNKIAFDLQLGTEYPEYVGWDSKLFMAVLTIDGDTIWDSNLAGLNQNGVFHIEININVPDGQHLLGLGIRTNTTVTQPYYYYYLARWDSINFVNRGTVTVYRPGDFNHDCIVNIFDLKTIAENWLTGGLDLNNDNILDFDDYAVFAKDWMHGCYQAPIGPTFIDPPAADFNNDLSIDYYDIFIFAGDWLAGGVTCIRADLNEDGLVNFDDFALFAEAW